MVGVTGIEPVEKHHFIGISDTLRDVTGQPHDAIFHHMTCSLALAWHARVPKLLALGYRNRRVLAIMLLGCLENCLPFFLSRRFAAVVRAYSAGESDFIAAAGKYRSPVSLDFLPDLVRHFCLPQFLSDCCGLRISSCNPRQLSCNALQVLEPYGLTIYRQPCHKMRWPR